MKRQKTSLNIPRKDWNWYVFFSVLKELKRNIKDIKKTIGIVILKNKKLSNESSKKKAGTRDRKTLIEIRTWKKKLTLGLLLEIEK